MAVSITVLTDGPADGEGRIVLDAPRVVLGRAESADVVLPDPSVSPRHATLRQHGAAWLLVDEGSTNGTWVSGVKLSPQSPRVVGSGDRVRLGRVWIEIATDVAAPPTSREATRALALALVRKALLALGEDVDAKVTCVAGPDEGKSLTVRSTHTLGRGHDADLVLDDADASRRHVEVSLVAGVVMVRDLGTKNGTFVGERRLDPKKPLPWSQDDELHVGADVFRLAHKPPLALAEIGRGEDERVLADELPGPPGAPIEVPEPLLPDETPLTRAERVIEKTTGWGGADAMIVLFALAVLAASVGGLVWLFR